MKKKTKIEAAREVVEQNGECFNVDCVRCYTTQDNCKIMQPKWTERKLRLAKAFIKRHEQKCGKKKVEPVVKENFTPETIKFTDPVPDYVYTIKNDGIDRCKVSAFVKNRVEQREEIVFTNGNRSIPALCYRTLEDAVQVAKKLWEVEE